MPGSDITTTKCPLCDWSNRTHLLPYHFVSHHPAKVLIGPVQFDHCLRGYVRLNKTDVDFAVCLTCKKGTAAETHSGNGARWIRLHSKKTDCRTAHAAALTAFKALQSTVAEVPVAAEAAPVINSLDAVWKRMKEDRHTRPALVHIEERFRAEFDDDSDNEGASFVLDMVDGFKQIARDAIGFRVAMEKQAAIAKEHELRINHLEVDMKQLLSEKEALRQQNESMLAELKMLRELIAEKHAASE